MNRRAALASLAGGAAWLAGRHAARAQPSPGAPWDPEEDLRNLRVVDGTEAGRRFVLVVPRHVQPDAELPVVVFLHGLGETMDPRLGAYAWLERYGLGQAWQRLSRPPIVPTGARGEWTTERLGEVNEELGARPFRGFVAVCPHMPNPSGPAEIEAYTTWVRGPLLARVRAELPFASKRRETTFLSGVSLGGWVSLEVLVRAPDVFGAWAGVQTAIGTWAASGFAERIANAQPRPDGIYVLTSTQDHWRASSEELMRALHLRSVPFDPRTIPGPHDQPWLREAGTIETMLWLDRQGRRAPRGAASRGLPTRDVVRSSPSDR